MQHEIQFEAFPVLETQRLILRELKLEDAGAMFQFASNVEVVRYYDPPMTTLEQVQRSIERHRTRFENGEGIRWGITVKREQDVVGTCGFFRDTPNFLASMSYVLDRPFWNKGLMTEALVAIIQFGFDHFQLHRIEADVAIPNVASLRVLQKLGFREEGRRRERLFENDNFHDEIVFSLLKSDERRKA